MSQLPPPLVKHPAQGQPAPLASQNGSTNAGAQFVPRREFIRDHRIASTFSLLTLSGSGFIRLYSFSVPLQESLKRFLNIKQLISAVREHKPKHFFEITLEGKPWGSPKSITAEKLIVDVLTIILHHGYTFLSTLDYGREQDDKLAVAFSKPQLMSPLQHSNGSALSLNMPLKSPFAISFSSATLLRVVGPPLHSTPAILTAVRGAWPRGVLTEKKVGDATYEFKLKGYRWFQEDNFATDSLYHILTLLTSLDAHGFTLLTSLSMTGRSRVKDLWIFTGEYHPDSQPSTPNGSNLELKREITPLQAVSLAPGPLPLALGSDRHTPPRQFQVPPAISNSGSASEIPGHVRAASDNTPATSSPLKPQTTTFTKVHNLIRKPSPKTQAQQAAALDSSQSSQDVSLAANGGVYPPPSAKRGSRSRLSLVPGQILRSLSNPNSIGSVDMTGVGAGLRKSADMQRTPDLFYATDGRTKESSRDRRSNPYFPPLAPEARPPHAAFFQGHERHTSEIDNRIDPRQSPRPSVTRSSTLPVMTPRQNSASSTTFPSIPRLQIQAPSPVVRNISDRAFGKETSKGTPTGASRTPTPPLLTPGTFRDSAFSSGTGWLSQDIPIAWTGKGPDLTILEPGIVEPRHVKQPLHTGANGSALEPPSIANGGAQREERSDVGNYKTSPPPRDQSSSRHDNRYSTHPSRRTRHSLQNPMSSATLGMLSGTPPPQTDTGRGSSASPGRDTPTKNAAGAPKRDTAMSGWVLVNVDNSAGSQGRSSTHSGGKKASSQSPPPSSRPAVRHRRSNSDSGLHRPHTRSPVGNAPAPATMSAAAKTIAMIDAVDAREKEQEKSSTPSGLRRIFHRSKGVADSEGSGSGTPRKRTPEGGVTPGRGAEEETRPKKSRGTPPATKTTDKRMSVD